MTTGQLRCNIQDKIHCLNLFDNLAIAQENGKQLQFRSCLGNELSWADRDLNYDSITSTDIGQWRIKPGLQPFTNEEIKKQLPIVLRFRDTGSLYTLTTWLESDEVFLFSNYENLQYTSAQLLKETVYPDGRPFGTLS